MFEMMSRIGGLALLTAILWLIVSVFRMIRSATRRSAIAQAKFAAGLLTSGLVMAATGTIFFYKDFGLDSRDGLSAAIKTRDANVAAEKAKRDAEDAARKEVKAADNLKEKCADATAAFVMSQTYISRTLKAPSSAKFPYITDDTVRVSKDGTCRFKVSSWVDSANSFGAEIRTRYSVTMTIDPSSDKWTGTDLVLE